MSPHSIDVTSDTVAEAASAAVSGSRGFKSRSSLKALVFRYDSRPSDTAWP